MISVGYTCDSCKNMEKELYDGWIPCCKAYPKGIPDEIYDHGTPETLKKCKHGFKYERIKEE